MKLIIFILLLLTISQGSPKDIQTYLDKHSDSLDIGTVSLLLSQDAFPHVDPVQGSDLFNYMADRVKQLVELSGKSDTNSLDVRRVGSLNTFFYKPGGWNRVSQDVHVVYTYDMAFEEGINWKALFLPSLIYERKGTCATLPLLWYIIAERLDWPVHLVRIPGHLFIKYDGMNYGNIDATVQGGYISDSMYIADTKITDSALEKGVYLKKMSKKEIVSTLVVNNAYYSITEKKDTVQALEYYRIALELDSFNVNALAGIGTLTSDQSLWNKAKSLGYTNGTYSNEFYRKRVTHDEIK